MKSREKSFRKAIKRESRFFVYIVQCKNGTYYTGYTNNLENRIKEHNSGKGAKYLRGRLPVKLVYAKEYRYYKNALHRERNIKKMTRRQKEELIRVYNENNNQNHKASDAPTDLPRRFASKNRSSGGKSKSGSTHV